MQTCKADQPDTMRMSMLGTSKASLHVHDEVCSSLVGRFGQGVCLI